MGKGRRFDPFSRLRSRDSHGHQTVVIETPKGSHNKYSHDPDRGVFELTKVLPEGEAFPFDFGYVPRTLGGDGDPLDVLLLMDQPAFPGCVVAARPIGVIEARQGERKNRGAKSVRNDRLIAVATESKVHRGIDRLDDLPGPLVEQIEEFFRSYNEKQGRVFTPLRRASPATARRLVEKGRAEFKKKG